MTDPAMYVGQCLCGAAIYRKTRSGAPPKRCDACRALSFKGGISRGKNGKAEPGPVRDARQLMQNLDPRIRMAVAGAILAQATGLSEPMAESVIETIDVLLAHGESEVDVRRRLNPTHTGFGTSRAGDFAALEEWMEETP